MIWGFRVGQLVLRSGYEGYKDPRSRINNHSMILEHRIRMSAGKNWIRKQYKVAHWNCVNNIYIDDPCWHEEKGLVDLGYSDANNILKGLL